MSLTNLTCPHCGFSKEVETLRLPPEGTKINCPRCRGSFPFAGAAAEAATSSPQAFFEHTPVQPVRPAPRRRTLVFTFTGSAREYFGIWIVNTLLRIVTFGIYSPWAKVRKRRYFYGNTLLDDAPFDYLADPLAILKGWFIAGLFLGLYSTLSNVSAIASLAGTVLFLAVYPWVIVRSRIFNLRNSTHRNIRFAFAPNYREAYKVFLWWQLLVPFTLGILQPYVIWRQKRFLTENSFYGATPFAFHAKPGDYYRLFVPILRWVIICLVLFGAVALALFGLDLAGGMMALAPLVPFFAFLVIYVVAIVYIPTAIANLTWNSTAIADHRFDSTLQPWHLAWIYLSNAIAMACTAGLLTPWAAVRLARYRLERVCLAGEGDLAGVVAGEQADVGAAGEEFGDMLGFDLGL